MKNHGRIRKVKSHYLYGNVRLHVLLIIALGALLYSNTFGVPFVFDDEVYIVKNPVIKDLGLFKDFSEAADRLPEAGVAETLSTRYLGHLSFALNYRLNGLDVWGYHAVNLAVHLLNALLVYLLVALTFRTPFIKDGPSAGLTGPVALTAALLFVSHPVQTEAVTYITQRFASLATFFYLLSISAYIGSRLSRGKSPRLILYGLSLLFALSAMKTKEISFTLPVVIAAYEFSFMRASAGRRALLLLPLMLTMLIVPLSLMDFGAPVLDAVQRASRTQDVISRHDYLLTQLPVVASYIRLLLLPMGQNLDYGYPLYNSLFEPRVLFSFLLILSLASALLYLVRLSGGRARVMRLAAFGGVWFFVTLSVESSVIPLADLIFEHRVYLPSAGFFTSISAGIFYVISGRGGMRAPVWAALAVLIIAFSASTYSRNAVWKDETTLWEDVVRKSPEKARGHINLGAIGSGRKAMEHLKKALLINPDDAEVHHNLGIYYGRLGEYERAGMELQTALKLDPENAKARYNLGNVHDRQGSYGEAEAEYRAAVEINPGFAEAHGGLGALYERQGLYSEAEAEYRAAVRLDPDYAEAHNSLGALYERRGLYRKAEAEYLLAVRLDPDYAGAHNNLGALYYRDGRLDEAEAEYQTAIRLDPESAKAHYNLGIVYVYMGSYREAEAEFQAALRYGSGNAELGANIRRAYELMEEAGQK
jgi:Flp pilus assembly protein TadD